MAFYLLKGLPKEQFQRGPRQLNKGEVYEVERDVNENSTYYHLTSTSGATVTLTEEEFKDLNTPRHNPKLVPISKSKEDVESTPDITSVRPSTAPQADRPASDPAGYDHWSLYGGGRPEQDYPAVKANLQLTTRAAIHPSLRYFKELLYKSIEHHSEIVSELESAEYWPHYFYKKWCSDGSPEDNLGEWVVNSREAVEKLFNDEMTSKEKEFEEFDRQWDRRASVRFPLSELEDKVTLLNKEWQDSFSGGLGDESSPSDFDRDSVIEGALVELEHTNDFKQAIEIALDHLSEDSAYYKKLRSVATLKIASGPRPPRSYGGVPNVRFWYIGGDIEWSTGQWHMDHIWKNYPDIVDDISKGEYDANDPDDYEGFINDFLEDYRGVFDYGYVRGEFLFRSYSENILMLNHPSLTGSGGISTVKDIVRKLDEQVPETLDGINTIELDPNVGIDSITEDGTWLQSTQIAMSAVREAKSEMSEEERKFLDNLNDTATKYFDEDGNPTREEIERRRALRDMNVEQTPGSMWLDRMLSERGIREASLEGVKIFLDDERDTPEGWTRTYTVEETIRAIQGGGVSIVSLDNDLGEGMEEGRKVAAWIEEQVWTNDDFNPPQINVHSANPVARDEMNAAIRSIARAMAKRDDVHRAMINVLDGLKLNGKIELANKIAQVKRASVVQDIITNFQLFQRANPAEISRGTPEHSMRELIQFSKDHASEFVTEASAFFSSNPNFQNAVVKMFIERGIPFTGESLQWMWDTVAKEGLNFFVNFGNFVPLAPKASFNITPEHKSKLVKLAQEIEDESIEEAINLIFS